MRDLLLLIKITLVLLAVSSSRRTKLYVLLSSLTLHNYYSQFVLKRLTRSRIRFKLKRSRNHISLNIADGDFPNIFRISCNLRTGRLLIFKRLPYKQLDLDTITKLSRKHHFYVARSQLITVERWYKSTAYLTFKELHRVPLTRRRLHSRPVKNFASPYLANEYDKLREKYDKDISVVHCHGDLVASNVLLTKNECVLIDFSDATVDYLARDLSTLCASLFAGEPHVNEIIKYRKNFSVSLVKISMALLLPELSLTKNTAFEIYLFGILCKLGDLSESSPFYEYYAEIYRISVLQYNAQDI